MKVRFIAILAITALFTACENNDHDDLAAFISNAGKGLRGQVDPLPEVKSYKFFTYDAFEMPSPFEPRKNEQAQSTGSGIKPDLTRRKEYLESFPLESLEMVGSLEQNEDIYAVVKTPEGSLLRVGIGNYMGQDFGRINQISESQIKLRELVQDGVNEWTERISTLMLKN
ncbi:MAG: pilus assembly protein PilP [Burkholderiales bacterium]|uniref:pilus assembly protein PilP n=1 Tax=Nitrosomonas sp. TaxID=42353 RepID=UPI001D4B19B5|nr:pilus assembly protein PilP [Nitrosomonas sp.]MCB1947662.1 pilus assembly protein PilP [Nitrosomonas sp.]MCP5241962.1 pilus assembly protein PilP [Burkholderiales bacterium]